MKILKLILIIIFATIVEKSSAQQIPLSLSDLIALRKGSIDNFENFMISHNWRLEDVEAESGDNFGFLEYSLAEDKRGNSKSYLAKITYFYNKKASIQRLETLILHSLDYEKYLKEIKLNLGCKLIKTWKTQDEL